MPGWAQRWPHWSQEARWEEGGWVLGNPECWLGYRLSCQDVQTQHPMASSKGVYFSLILTAQRSAVRPDSGCALGSLGFTWECGCSGSHHLACIQPEGEGTDGEDCSPAPCEVHSGRPTHRFLSSPVCWHFGPRSGTAREAGTCIL